MRFIFLWIALTVCFSACKNKTNEEGMLSENMTFSLDTVFVDPGEEIIYLKDNLFLSDLSPDKSYLVNFNRADLIYERINLDELELEEKIQFEKEGPDGMPVYFSGFNINTEEQLLIWSYQFYSLFDQNANKVRDLGLEKIAADLLGSSDTYPLALFEVSGQPDRILGVFIQWKDRNYFILDFDLVNRNYTKTDLPELAKLQAYNTDILYDGQHMGSFGVGLFPIGASSKIILANNSINEVLVFEQQNDSSYVKSWDSPLLGARKKYLPPEQAEETSGEVDEIEKKSKEDINYGRLIWDDSQKRFLRFSASEQFGEEKNEFGQYISTGATVYLSIFDENLNLLAESLIPELKAPPKKHFVKDGKIWIFENIDDELAFIRLEVR